MLRAARLAAAAPALLVAVSCAPRVAPPPRLDTAAAPGRYLAALAGREQAARALDADVRVWVEGAAFGELPGVSGTLVLAGPDRCRLRVNSAFGTLVDVAARGDTVTAFVPSRRVVLDLPHAGDTLGVRAPGALLVRVWSAAWRPPDRAWRNAVARDSLLHLAWTEGADSLELAVDGAGRPRQVRMARADGADLRCRYLAWESLGRVAWPAWLEFQDAAGTVRAECRVGALRARAGGGRDRTALRVPEGAGRLEWSRLRAALERLAGL